MTRHTRPSESVSFRTLIAVGVGITALVLALSVRSVRVPVVAATESGAPAPIYGVTLPPGYRDWALISVATVGSPVNDIRAKLGNDVAISAFRQGTIPYPERDNHSADRLEARDIRANQ